MEVRERGDYSVFWSANDGSTWNVGTKKLSHALRVMAEKVSQENMVSVDLMVNVEGVPVASLLFISNPHGKEE